jgi:hypothetical protein
MKTNSIDQKKKFNIHHINIKVFGKKKYLQKHYTYFQVFELYFSN